MGKAILVVSFGAVSAEARKNSLDKIEKEIEIKFNDYKIYRAYTSGIVIRRISELENIEIDNVHKAFEKMKKDGITDVIVQPTHMINGIEYNKICKVCEEYSESFSSIKVGKAMLTNYEDCIEMTEILRKIINFDDDFQYILMGHGTEDAANERYLEMNRALKENGFSNAMIATVEGSPSIDDSIKEIKSHDKKVILQPFMMVAGDHARNDMAGEKNSFFSTVKASGYEAECVIIGLGEYKKVRQIIINNIEGMIN